MSYSSRFALAHHKCMDKLSGPIMIQYYSKTIGSVYDDDVVLTQSGTNLWASGVVESLNLTRGSTDSNLVEQGKLINSDSKLYVHGSLVLTGKEAQFRVQLGSPTGNWYSLMPEGGIDHQVNGVYIFKAAYIRQITGTGSLIGSP